jgi:predicted XRE-type DNA-binding protein
MPNANKPSHVTKGSVFDDLGLSRAEATEAKVKAELWRELVGHIKPLKLTQKELALRLDVHQPEVSHLLNGKLSKFSVGALIAYAVKLDLGVKVSITAPVKAKS